MVRRKRTSVDDYDFKGVFVPKEIWVSREMAGSEKLILIEIHALDRKFGCVADNEHFALLFGMSVRQVQRYIKELKEKGFVSVEINKANDTRVMSVIGKYARIKDEDLERLGSLKKLLVDKYRA